MVIKKNQKRARAIRFARKKSIVKKYKLHTPTKQPSTSTVFKPVFSPAALVANMQANPRGSASLSFPVLVSPAFLTFQRPVVILSNKVPSFDYRNENGLPYLLMLSRALGSSSSDGRVQFAITFGSLRRVVLSDACSA